MLFLQPVVVNDALAAERSAPAEVRIAERASYEQMTWTGTTLAQASIDGRSPFGPNAPNANDMSPKRTLANPADLGQTPGPTAAPASPSDPSSTTKIPPARAPDAGPPPGTTTTNPDRTTDTAATGTVAPSTATPGTTPSTATPGTTRTTTTPGAGGGTGGIPGTRPPSANTSMPQTVPSADIPGGGPQPSSTLPGGSSGASNTR